MLDGFLLRSRIQAVQMEACRTDVSLFAQAVVAFTLGIIDEGNDERTVSEALNSVIRKP
jgi:hypothetical protein